MNDLSTCLVKINKHCKVKHPATSVQAVIQEQILAKISEMFLKSINTIMEGGRRTLLLGC